MRFKIIHGEQGRTIIMSLVTLLLTCSLAFAQKGEQPQLSQNQPQLKVNHAKTDTVWFEFKQDGKKVVAEVMLFNDQPIAGGQIPLKYGNGKSPIEVDSVVFDSKRAGKFDVANGTEGIDKATQTIRIGFLADISGRKPPLEPGKGRLLSIYLSLKTDKPFEVVLDTTSLTGGYSLMMADQAAQTIPVAFKTGKFKTK